MRVAVISAAILLLCAAASDAQPTTYELSLQYVTASDSEITIRAVFSERSPAVSIVVAGETRTAYPRVVLGRTTITVDRASTRQQIVDAVRAAMASFDPLNRFPTGRYEVDLPSDVAGLEGRS